MPASHHTDIADALERATKAAPKGVVKSAALQRGDREILRRAGYLRDIVKGWYFLVRPGLNAGESTAWYASFWNFIETYLAERFAADYCLSAVASLELHSGVNTVPRQVIAVTAHGGKTLLNLPHETSLLVYQDAKSLPQEVAMVNGLRVMPLPLALCRLPPVYFRANPVNAELALRALPDVGTLIRLILDMRSPTLASRFAGAFSFLGDDRKAKAIETAAQAVGLQVKRENPFDRDAAVLASFANPISPYAGRIEVLFRLMRGPVIEAFKDIKPKVIRSADACMRRIDDAYVNDAYNSLSIEGYQVNPELIRRIRMGQWNPDGDPRDEASRNAMAAKGYLEAFILVKESIRAALGGKDAAGVACDGYQDWYRALFSETVKAGLMEAGRLAGHRNGPVFIRSSRHVPPPATGVTDAVEALFRCLKDEEHPGVRGVLGHWLFGYIHPFMDGNGRIARFLMNVMLTTAGYPWTIVRTTHRAAYMAALEAASTQSNIVPFTRFVLQEMQVDWSKAPSARKATR